MLRPEVLLPLPTHISTWVIPGVNYSHWFHWNSYWGSVRMGGHCLISSAISKTDLCCTKLTQIQVFPFFITAVALIRLKPRALGFPVATGSRWEKCYLSLTEILRGAEVPIPVLGRFAFLDQPWSKCCREQPPGPPLTAEQGEMLSTGTALLPLTKTGSYPETRTSNAFNGN